MIKTKNDFPKEAHFAALVFKSQSIQHEGDERSRTHPGHGYPAYTETIHTIEYIAFPSKAEMEKWVLRMETKREKETYQLIEAKPLSATLSATVSVG